MTVRVRFAPSPTGSFHVGGARTALFNYLFAKQNDGKFIIRIEDTDQKRFNKDAVTELLDALEWLGLDWDEGPSYQDLIDLGVSEYDALKWQRVGEYPYVQTHRKVLYHHYVQQLIDEEKAYRVFAEELDLEKKDVRFSRLAKEMDLNKYRTMTKRESDRLAADGRDFHVRLKLPRSGSIFCTDYIRGDVSFRCNKLVDPVIMKTDGIPTYHLASVVDDHLMEITHVLRGEEWLSSYPLHTYLYRAFKWNPPIFLHLPVILNPTGKGKMSKRESRAPDGSVVPVFVKDYKSLGFIPEALNNFMGLIGIGYDGVTELMSMEEMVEKFDLRRIRRTGSAWDYKKLKHFNQHYIKQMSNERFIEYARRFI